LSLAVGPAVLAIQFPLGERFPQDNGFNIVERLEPEFPPHIRDQVWGYNIRFNKMRRPAS